jgi:hypothetical protein
MNTREFITEVLAILVATAILSAIAYWYYERSGAAQTVDRLSTSGNGLLNLFGAITPRGG